VGVNWISYLLAIGAGAANPAQAGANAELRKALGLAIFTAIAVYISGLIGVLIIQVFVREAMPTTDKLAQVPWWAWTGGLLSIASTMAGLTLAQRMGSGVFTGLSVTASLAMSIVLDNYGWVGFKVHPASWPRVLGCGFMIVGLWLVAKF
jgi:transporter family-2 protein